MEHVNRECPWTYEKSKTVIIEILKESVSCVEIIPRIKKVLQNNGTDKTKFSTRFYTICHNDMWIKNILVKFDSRNPDKVKFVGHLFHTFDSPSKDIILFFLTSVQTRILRNNLDDLLRFYYINFIQVLEDLKISTSYYSFELFLKEFAMCTEQVICSALFVLLFVIYGKESGSNSPIDPPN